MTGPAITTCGAQITAPPNYSRSAIVVVTRRGHGDAARPGTMLNGIRADRKPVRADIGRLPKGRKAFGDRSDTVKTNGTHEMRRRTEITEGSGNVFADLGFDRPDEELVKAELIRRIRTILSKRQLTQAVAAKVLGIKQPDVSALMRGRISGFSLERLMRLLMRLDRDVEIVVKRKPKSREARLRVATD